MHGGWGAAVQGGGEPEEDEAGGATAEAWDAQCAWRPWAAQQDPITLMELDAVWEGRQVGGAAGAAGGTAAGVGRRGAAPGGWPLDPASADRWEVHALERGAASASARGSLGMRAVERPRTHVRLHTKGADGLWTAALAASAKQHGWLAGVAPLPYGASSDLRGVGSLAISLSALLTARTAAQCASSCGDMAGGDWWLERCLDAPPPPLPPESVVQEVLRDILDLDSGTAPATSGSSSSRAAQAAAAAAATLPRTAPPDSLLARLALHVLLFGNARAVVLLWRRLVSELRLAYWEEGRPLPRMPAGAPAAASQNGAPGSAAAAGSAAAEPPPLDLGACLLQQKLQLLNVCIARRSNGSARKPPAQHPSLASLRSFSAISSSPSSSEYGECQEEGEEGAAAGEGEAEGDEPWVSADDAAASSAADGVEAAAPPQEAGSSGAAGCEPAGLGSGTEAVPQAVAGVVAGTALAHYPDRPLRIPLSQVCTCGWPEINGGWGFLKMCIGCIMPGVALNGSEARAQTLPPS